ncbi:MAG: universal stress protein [Clostridia bacterium]|nr:universal stress protein [Clostridia bacterium]
MRILVAVDGSEASRRAAATARRLCAGVEKAEVVVLHVFERPPWREGGDWLEGVEEALRAGVEKAMDAAVRELEGGAEVVTMYTVGDPAAQIVQVAAESGADLIVVGHRGLGRLGLPLGSVSEKVVRSAGCPVLVVR